MMKIVAMIDGSPGPTVYFANAIHRESGLTAAIVQRAKTHATRLKTKKPSKDPLLERILRYALFRAEMRRRDRKHEESREAWENKCDQLFDSMWRKLDETIPQIEVEDINDRIVMSRLEELHPDVIVDHGTALVKDEILQLAELALNLHWGLSPYYRGINCTERALLNWDPLNIGVTIHKLAKQIDGGDILGQARATIDPKEPFQFIPLQLTQLGTAIMIKALKKLSRGERLVFHEQMNWNGFLHKGKHWTPEFQQFCDHLDEEMLTKILQSPSRSTAPIIEL